MTQVMYIVVSPGKHKPSCEIPVLFIDLVPSHQALKNKPVSKGSLPCR